MTEQQINEAIAEACGWTAVGMGYLEHSTGFGDHLLIGHKGGPAKAIPNYFKDLNACAEARRSIIATVEQRVKYLNELHKIISRRPDVRRNNMSQPCPSDYDVLDATALEICEALLKVIGKLESLK